MDKTTKDLIIIEAHDYSEYYFIRVYEMNGAIYVIFEYEGKKVVTQRRFYNSEEMLKEFRDLYIQYKTIDRLPMSISIDKFGLGNLK